MMQPKDRLRKTYSDIDPKDPASQAVLARRKYHEAAAIWLAKWLTPLQAFFGLLGFSVVLLPMFSKSWRNLVEATPLLAEVFHDYSTLSGFALLNLFAGMLTTITKPYWAKHSPSGPIPSYRNGVAPLACPITTKEEISFWIEIVSLILVTTVWLFLPFGVIAYLLRVGE